MRICHVLATANGADGQSPPAIWPIANCQLLLFNPGNTGDSGNIGNRSDAGPVSRILCGVAAAMIIPLGRPLLNGSSDLPEGWAHRAGTHGRQQLALRACHSLPIWSCSVWGLPCPAHYCASGALLPHLFTLTLALRPGRYVLCCTFRLTGLNPPSRTLSGTLLCGVRTFLPLLAKTAIIRPGISCFHYRGRSNWQIAIGIQHSAFSIQPTQHSRQFLLLVAALCDS
jgi:hypothetical protein